MIVLAEILASPLNYGYSAPIWRVLEALNGTRMRSLRQLLAAYDAFDGEFLDTASDEDLVEIFDELKVHGVQPSTEARLKSS